MSRITAYTFRSNPAADPASTNDYVDIPVTAVTAGDRPTVVECPTSGTVSVTWRNTGANSITTRVLQSNNRSLADAQWFVSSVASEGAEAAIAAAGVRHIVIPIAAFQFIKFQQKATVGGSQGASQLHGRHARI